MNRLESARVMGSPLILGILIALSFSASPKSVAQGPSQSSPGIARVFIYHRNSAGTEKHPCCNSDQTVFLNGESFSNGDSLAQINEIGSYVIYEVEAPFPTSLLFWYQSLVGTVSSIGCSQPGCVLTYYYGPPELQTRIPLLLQVEAGKNYYIEFGPDVPPSSMKLMKEEIGVRDLAGLKLAEQKHIAAPTVEEAIGIIDSDLSKAKGSGRSECVEQQIQDIVVNKDGLQFTEVGKVDFGFRKKEYSVLVSMRFEGMSYLRIPTDKGSTDTLNLPASDFEPKPGMYVMNCVENLTSADLPRFVEAVNKLIWNASAGGKQ